MLHSRGYDVPLLVPANEQALEHYSDEVPHGNDKSSSKGVFSFWHRRPRCQKSPLPSSVRLSGSDEASTLQTLPQTETSGQSAREVLSPIPSTLRRRSRLSTLVTDPLRHTLRRLPTFVRLRDHPTYGDKTIGQLGSFIYLINQIFGAGILALPYVIKASGWLPSFLANLLVCMVAMFGTLMIMRSMTMIAGNQNFEKRVEYIPTVEYFLGKKFRVWTELCFYLSIQSLNVVSIAVVAQSVDHLLLKVFGSTYGVVIDPGLLSMGFKRLSSQIEIDHIYSGDTGLIFGITLGYLINSIICICLSTQTMDENMRIQYVSFTFLMTSIVQISVAAALRIWSPSWFSLKNVNNEVTMKFDTTTTTTTSLMPKNDLLVVAASVVPFNQTDFLGVLHQTNLSRSGLLDQKLPSLLLSTNYRFNESLSKQQFQLAKKHSPKTPLVVVKAPSLLGQYQYGQLLSTFIASYSYVNVIPSWANEMTPGVRVNEAVWLSSAFACVVYYVFGYLLAYAYPTVHTDNILQEVLSNSTTDSVTKVFIYIFNLLTILPGILVYSITTRYNLVNSKATSPSGGFFVGCVLPFTFAWLLANDNYFSAVLQWSSLLFSLAVNFVIPSSVYVTACGVQRLATRNPTRHLTSMQTYASRAKKGVNSIVGDVSSQLRHYLRSLPSAELDPHIAILLNQPTPRAALTHTSSSDLHIEKNNNRVQFLESDETTERSVQDEGLIVSNRQGGSQLSPTRCFQSDYPKTNLRNRPHHVDTCSEGYESLDIKMNERNRRKSAPHVKLTFCGASQVKKKRLHTTQKKRSNDQNLMKPPPPIIKESSLLVPVAPSSGSNGNLVQLVTRRTNTMPLPLSDWEPTTLLLPTTTTTVAASPAHFGMRKSHTAGPDFKETKKVKHVRFGSDSAADARMNFHSLSYKLDQFLAKKKSRKNEGVKSFLADIFSFDQPRISLTRPSKNGRPFGPVKRLQSELLFLNEPRAHDVHALQKGSTFQADDDCQTYTPPNNNNNNLLRQSKKEPTLVLPSSENAPAITISSTPDPSPKLLTHSEMNPLLKFVSSEFNFSSASSNSYSNPYPSCPVDCPISRWRCSTHSSDLQECLQCLPGRIVSPAEGGGGGCDEINQYLPKTITTTTILDRSDRNCIKRLPTQLFMETHPQQLEESSHPPSYERPIKHGNDQSPLWILEEPSLEVDQFSLTGGDAVRNTGRHFFRNGIASSQYLAPPPLKITEMPVEPPIELMVNPVRGAEDAYECDEEPITGDLKSIRIHVYPEGLLRRHHLLTTQILMGLLVLFCILSASSQLIVDTLRSMGKLSAIDDATIRY